LRSLRASAENLILDIVTCRLAACQVDINHDSRPLSGIYVRKCLDVGNPTAKIEFFPLGSLAGLPSVQTRHLKGMGWVMVGLVN